MHSWMDGWDWLWMSFIMSFWIVMLGVVVYIAVRLARRPPTNPKPGSTPVGAGRR